VSVVLARIVTAVNLEKAGCRSHRFHCTECQLRVLDPSLISAGSARRADGRSQREPGVATTPTVTPHFLGVRASMITLCMAGGSVSGVLCDSRSQGYTTGSTPWRRQLAHHRHHQPPFFCTLSSSRSSFIRKIAFFFFREKLESPEIILRFGFETPRVRRRSDSSS